MDKIEYLGNKLCEAAEKIVNQIICTGGEDLCQSCIDRENLAEAIHNFRLVVPHNPSLKADKLPSCQEDIVDMPVVKKGKCKIGKVTPLAP